VKSLITERVTLLVGLTVPFVVFFPAVLIALNLTVLCTLTCLLWTIQTCGLQSCQCFRFYRKTPDFSTQFTIVRL